MCNKCNVDIAVTHILVEYPRYLAICRKYYSNPSMLGMLKKTDDFSVNKLMYLQEIGRLVFLDTSGI